MTCRRVPVGILLAFAMVLVVGGLAAGASAGSSGVLGPDDLPDVLGQWVPHDVEGWGLQILVRFVGDSDGTVIRASTWQAEEPDQCPPTDAVIWEFTDVTPTAASGQVNHYGVDDDGECVAQSTSAAIVDRDGDELRVRWETSGADGEAVARFERRGSVYGDLIGGSHPAYLGPFLVSHVRSELVPPAADGPVVMLATSAAFPDALAAAGYGGALGAFTQLLSPTDRADNLALLEAISPPPSRYLVIGGSGALPDQVLPDPTDPDTPPMARIAGTNRFDTAARLADAGWPDGASTVLIATGANYPDALAGGAIAAMQRLPVLLVDGDRIPSETMAAIQRLQPDTIVILGGRAAVPESVENELAGHAGTVTRAAGSNRVETAIALSQAMLPTGEVRQATLVPGDRPDEALMAAPLGAHAGGPLLLLQSTVPGSLVAELQRLGVTNLTVVSAADGIADVQLHELEEALGLGLDPSPRIATFYYPWYFNPTFDGQWDHWGTTNPPQDIAADYYPVMGAYSMSDPTLLEQHFRWLRQAGIGLIVSSWWGVDDPTDQTLPLLLDVADAYDVKVAFHIENPDGRTAERLVRDFDYLVERYGDHPAFFWTDQTSCHSPDNRPKALLFLWASIAPDGSSPPVTPEYWRGAVDTVHARDRGAIILTDQVDASWMGGGHFDGAYSYAVLDSHEFAYEWAADLPSCAWYVPGINPGFSAREIGYPISDDTPRRAGATFADRWQRMFDVGIEPSLVAITTFNEWHEGTQIEPAVAGASRSDGAPYLDYGPLTPSAYLDLTAEWAEIFLRHQWPASTPVRLHVRTTSDWTDLRLLSGASWGSPELVSASDEAIQAELRDGAVQLTQPIEAAEDGNEVHVTLDLLVREAGSVGPLVFQIDRGHLGTTWVTLSRFDGQEWVEIATFSWGEVNPGPANTAEYSIEHDEVFIHGDVATR